MKRRKFKDYYQVLKEIKSTDQLLTLEESARLLGKTVKSFYTYRKKYHLRHVNKDALGRNLLFKTSDVINFGLKHSLIVKTEERKDGL